MAFTGIGLDDLDKWSRAGCSLGKYLFAQFSKGPSIHLTPELKIYVRAKTFYGLIPLKHMVSKTEVLEFEIWSPEDTDEGSAISSDPRFDNCYVFSPAHKPHGLFDGGIEFRLTTEKGKSTLDLQSRTLFTLDIEELSEKDKRVDYSKPMLADPLAQGTITSIKHWISECDREQAQTHAICSVSEPHFLPSRLIRVRPRGSNPDDMTLEISQMAEVYTHATLTIVAKRANDAQDGFLHKRLLPSGTSTMMFRYRNGQEGTVTLSFESALSDEFGTRLDTRGWVLQEYLLSRRLLVIGNWATEWSCRHERYSPDNVDGWSRETMKETDPFKYNEIGSEKTSDALPEDSHTLDAIAFYAAHPGSALPRPGEWPVHQTWNGLVESYTERSGQELQRHCQDLPGTLLWRNTTRQKLPRPDKWQEPSWSWVAINDQVEGNFARESPCAEVEHVHCELVSPQAPFGELREGGALLRIRGCAIDLDWRYIRPKKPKQKFGTDGSDIRYLNSGHTYVDAEVLHFLDAREPATDWAQITLLLIDPGWLSNAEGIMLKKARGGKHSRLGYFELRYNGDTKGFDSPLPSPRSWEKEVFEII
ncbi:HET domain-containing protein [Fusarium oxysporum f. sp. phaseoli]